MSRAQCCKAIWDLHYHEDMGARWELAQSLAKFPEFADEFNKIKSVYDGHVAGSVAAGIGAAFTAGALAGLSAGEAARACAVLLNYFAYCIQKGLDEGIFQRPEPSGSEIIDHHSLSDVQLWEVCKRLMREEKLAAEYAVVKAIHDCWVTKVISYCVSAAAGGGNDDLYDLGLNAEGMPELFDTVSKVKEVIGRVDDAQDIADETPFAMLRNYILLCMEQRKARQ
eukprot:TRINITY_DN42015_c0_g1_i1.p1 TRINITY_DN42015_c0_g1~~TRINITY_DN42015_c0_g1_i1.p1  ORF type:complete len:251 (+),score=61.99 TRINITY_DN42015_c0_g1_i1:81-755(+)